MKIAGSKSVVWCKLPNAGLGNQLFPLMRAKLFASLNNLPLIVTNYHQFRVGPYLRREKIKRNYKGYFVFEKFFAGELLDRRKVSPAKFKNYIIEPQIEKWENIDESTLFEFSKISFPDLFKDLKKYRTQVHKLFFELLNPRIISLVNGIHAAAPEIGVHIRRGDFNLLKVAGIPGITGLTPEEYFINVIIYIRSVVESEIPVCIFSDGYFTEFKKIFTLKNIKFVEGNPDIVDMLLLSRSKLIVTSSNSTFSYWAGFLSDAPIILHPQYLETEIRDSNNFPLFEGPIQKMDKEFLRKLFRSNEAVGIVKSNENSL